MSVSQPCPSEDISLLKEKIRLKKLDRNVYVAETEERRRQYAEERRAHRVGNVCLSHMTRKQNMMPIHLNAAIFENQPLDEKQPMQKIPLQQSIVINDSKLFKLGKRLLKQDYLRDKQELKLAKTKDELKEANTVAQSAKEKYEYEYEKFLHRQAMVEDSNNRELAAKLIYQRLQKILDEVEKDVKSYPKRISKIEITIAVNTKELKDFQELRDRAIRYLAIESNQLNPLDKELPAVTEHFEGLISKTKNEIDDRRKKGELNGFAYGENTLNLSEQATTQGIKFKKRNKSFNQTYSTMMALKDAMMVSDIETITDCFRDQLDVTELLNDEKNNKQKHNDELRARLDTLRKNNQFFKFDNNKACKYKVIYRTVVEEETMKARDHEEMEQILRKQDKLVSSLHLTIHALMEKLRPIKLDPPMNVPQGELVKDIQSVNKKMEKMMTLIETNSIPIGRVKPFMLQMFKEKRLPADCARVDLSHPGHGSTMSSYETFQADQPGLVTREFLKMRALAESGANKKKKNTKGGGAKGRRK